MEQQKGQRISVKDRYKARKLCVEALYVHQYGGVSPDLLISLAWLTGSNLPAPLVIEYYTHLVAGVLKHQMTIDQLIEKFAPKYGKQRIFKIDIAILELGIFSLIYDEEIPVGVAINESLKLAKEYSGIEAHKFINGVLDAVHRQRDGIADL